MTFSNAVISTLRKFTLVTLLIALAPIAAHAQDATRQQTPTRIQTVEGITEYRLSNGLKVLLAPDVADDKVTVNLTYMVGGRHEGYGETGMAHLLEHLIFKGTPTTKDPKVEFRQRGFTFNGTTTVDRTNYYATFVSNQAALDWYIGWQADAMVNSFIAKKDLDSEMTVVRSELEINENNPVQALGQRMARAAYMWHAYGKSVIGALSDIENVDIAKLQAFYKRYYRPDNAVMIVVGNFDVAQTLASIQKSLGSIAKPDSALLPTYTLETPQDGERSVVVRRPAPTQVILASYHIPAALHADSTALTVLATALGDVPSGRLHKALVESKLAIAAFAGANAQREAGSILFGAAFSPDDAAPPRQKILLDIVESLTTTPITAEEFERAKIRLNKTLELGFASAAGVADGAIAMEVMGDWRAIFVARERMKTVTLDDVNRVARTYLLESNRTYGHLLPTKTPARAPSPQKLDVAGYLQGFTFAEKGLESVAFDFSSKSLHEKVVFAETPGGVKMAMLAKPVRSDLVRLGIRLKFGSIESLQNQNAAAAVANAMLTKGTTSMSRQQIQDGLVKLGVALNVNFNEVGGGLTLNVKKDSLKPAIALAMHLLKASNFPEAEFEEARSAWVKSIEGEIKDKSTQANNVWGRYGNPYPMGDPRYAYTLEERLQQAKSVTREDAFKFYQRFYGAANAEVTLLGPIEVEEYRPLLTTALDGWRAPEAWTRIPNPLVDIRPTRLVFDTPDKTNVTLRAYHRMPVSSRGMKSEDAALTVATRIFGGGPGSRLWVRLREKGGLSYSAGAGFSASAYEQNGSISINAEVAPQNVSAAEAALQEELQRSLKDGFTSAEVENFKRQTLADRLRERSGDAWAARFMSTQLEFNYPKDEREKNDALIAALTADDINAAWKKYVQPEKLVWGVFGDQSKIK